jgi:hypothetical protein
MFNVQPERRVPGLHNFRPPEELVPGFRMNADGSTREATVAPPPYPALLAGFTMGSAVRRCLTPARPSRPSLKPRWMVAPRMAPPSVHCQHPMGSDRRARSLVE